MLEADVKRAMVKAVKAAGGYGRRIEDQYGVGILDTIIIPKCRPVFLIEAKIIRHDKFEPTERQWVEMTRVFGTHSKHVIPLLVGWKDKIHYVAGAVRSAQASECQFYGTDFLETLERYYQHVR